MQVVGEHLAGGQHAAGPTDPGGDEAAGIGVGVRPGRPVELAAVVVEPRHRQADAVGAAERRNADVQPQPEAGVRLGNDWLGRDDEAGPQVDPAAEEVHLRDVGAAPEQRGLAGGREQLVDDQRAALLDVDDQHHRPALRSARHREVDVEEVAEREQPVARRLDPGIGGIEGDAGSEAQHRQLADDERGRRLAVAGDPHRLDHVAGAEARIGERHGVGRGRAGGLGEIAGIAGAAPAALSGDPAATAARAPANKIATATRPAPARASMPQHTPTAEFRA